MIRKYFSPPPDSAPPPRRRRRRRRLRAFCGAFFITLWLLLAAAGCLIAENNTRVIAFGTESAFFSFAAPQKLVEAAGELVEPEWDRLPGWSRRGLALLPAGWQLVWYWVKQCIIHNA